MTESPPSERGFGLTNIAALELVEPAAEKQKRFEPKAQSISEISWSIGVTLLRIVVLLILPLAAFADDVKTFLAKDANLSSYLTFKWDRNVANTRYGIVEDEPTIGPMVRRAVSENLVKYGLNETAEDPDLLIRTLVLNSASSQLEALIYNWAGDVKWSVGSPMVSVGRYNRAGTLIVNVLDAKTEKSVWLGMVVRSLGKPEKIEKDVQSAASKLFKKFPRKK